MKRFTHQVNRTLHLQSASFANRVGNERATGKAIHVSLAKMGTPPFQRRGDSTNLYHDAGTPGSLSLRKGLWPIGYGVGRGNGVGRGRGVTLGVAVGDWVAVGVADGVTEGVTVGVADG